MATIARHVVGPWSLILGALALVTAITASHQLLFLPVMLLTVAGFFLPGYAIIRSFWPTIDTFTALVISPALSYAIYGLIMLAFLAFHWPYNLITPLHAGLLIAALVVVVRSSRRVHLEAATGWALLTTFALFVSAATFLALPGVGSDIPNLLSADIHHTRIPMLPGDSYLPYRTAQFVVHRLDLEQESYYYGHLISERTPWVGLVVAYWLLALQAEIPTIIHTIGGFWIFEIVGVFLNSLIALAGLWLGSILWPGRLVRWAPALLLLNPFLFMHTVYTRPAHTVGYLVLLSFGLLVLYQRRHHPTLAIASGIMAGFAYLTHPLGAAYGIGAGVYLLIDLLRRRRLLGAVMWGTVVLTLTLPWEYWTRFVYGHPSVFYQYAEIYGGTTALGRVWSWIVSIHRTVFGYYFSIYPKMTDNIVSIESFMYDNVFFHYLFVLPGALTIIGVFPAYASLVMAIKKYKSELFSFIMIPFLVLVVIMPTHVGQTTYGMHPIVVIMLLLSADFLETRPRWRLAVLAGALLELAFVVWYFLYPLPYVFQRPPVGLYFAAWCALLGALLAISFAAHRRAMYVGGGHIEPGRFTVPVGTTAGQRSLQPNE